MKTKKFENKNIFINRELSWLEFNKRVLAQGLNKELPLLERLKFLSIVSSNLDEFYMIRVAGLFQQINAGIKKRDSSGLSPLEQIKLIRNSVIKMVRQQTNAIDDIIAKLSRKGLYILRRKNWTYEQENYLSGYFDNNIMPVLTPLSMDDLKPAPLISARQIHVAVLISSNHSAKVTNKIVIIPVPSLFGRFIEIPSEEGLYFCLLEEVILNNITKLFPNNRILSAAYFRITRDADVEVQEDEAMDLIASLEKALLERKRRSAVRLEISSQQNGHFKKWFTDNLEIDEEDIYETDSMLDASSLMKLTSIKGFESLKVNAWPPQEPKDLLEYTDIFDAIQKQDILLFHPYETFEPVIELLEKASDDPNVLAIKQTLYRTSKDSPIIKALERAAANGKEVTVLVELKARFDESRNVGWARKMEDAGCHVIYGVVGLKTHAKAMLIVRREENNIRRYAHLSTGNYNELTSKIYSDIGIMTCDSDITRDISSFFNLLTGSSEITSFSRLTIAPTGLRSKIIEMIEREICLSTPDRPGLIMAKMNSIEDKEICKALYKASSAGVKIKLNIRGICCLKPGIKGVSENIDVVSIVDRYLEHARIFYFNNSGHPEVYLSSADWMQRNLDKRLEILFPILSQSHKERLILALNTYFDDNTNSYILLADGSYKLKKKGSNKIRAQQILYETAVKSGKQNNRSNLKFQPIINMQK